MGYIERVILVLDEWYRGSLRPPHAIVIHESQKTPLRADPKIKDDVSVSSSGELTVLGLPLYISRNVAGPTVVDREGLNALVTANLVRRP